MFKTNGSKKVCKCKSKHSKLLTIESRCKYNVYDFNKLRQQTFTFLHFGGWEVQEQDSSMVRFLVGALFLDYRWLPSPCIFP